MSIKVENVTKFYGEQAALNNVSFEVNTGQVVGFLGPNGAGKSTMMKIITCYTPPSAGRVWVCGYDVEEESIEVRKNIGYLPEHNPLYLDMYVKEYLIYVARIYGIKDYRNALKEMIETVGLELEQNKKIGMLSKGYRQRVGLAQALIHDPKVLILDEPTSGLDPNQLQEIRSLIKNIGREKTVILSTHIMQEVKAICERVLIINRGEIVANEDISLLQSKGNNNYSAIIEFNEAVSLKLLTEIKGAGDIENLGNNKWRITSSQDKDIRGEIFHFAVKNNLTVVAMQLEEQNLEEVFKQLTKSAG